MKKKYLKSVLTAALAAGLIFTALPGTAFAGAADPDVEAENGNSEENAISDGEATDGAENTDDGAAAEDAAPLTSADVPGTIANGVTIEGTDVSGMNFDEAKAAANEYAAKFGSVNFTVKAGNLSVNATGADFGIGAQADEVCRLAVQYGKTGNPLERYLAQKKCDKGEAVDFSIPLAADAASVQNYLTQNQAALSSEVVNNGLKRENGQFIFVAGTPGVSIDVAAGTAKITDYVDSSWDGGDSTIELDTQTVEPEGDEEQLRAVQDVLGTFTTRFSDSSAGRKQNIQVGTANINGAVVYPGETLSASAKMKKRTAQNGYAVASAYENGLVVDAIGGGVCQVSSTLYNAVIRAELEVVERSPHSMKVSYVEPADDAAIAEGLKDFVFKNNQDYPVYIEGITSGSSVTFTVYGKETRPANRKVSFVSNILSTTASGNTFNLDGTVPVGTVTRTSGGHQGIKAELIKIVTVDGQEQSRSVFNKSSYKMTNNIYTVGAAGASAEGLAAVKAAIATGDLATVKAAAAGAAAPAVTPTPTPAQTPSVTDPAAGTTETPAAETPVVTPAQ